MAVREILLLGNPALRIRCDEVKDFSGAALRRTIDDLLDTLNDFRRGHGFGRGIAAPQIGATQRITVLNVDAPLSLLNPVIVKKSSEMMTLWDDCFSFPDILVKVRRHTRITVHYADPSGTENELDAEGALSELLQHEIDHLEGILAIDRAVDSRHIVLRSEWEKQKHAPRHAYSL